MLLFYVQRKMRALEMDNKIANDNSTTFLLWSILCTIHRFRPYHVVFTWDGYNRNKKTDHNLIYALWKTYWFSLGEKACKNLKRYFWNGKPIKPLTTKVVSDSEMQSAISFYDMHITTKKPFCSWPKFTDQFQKVVTNFLH